MAARPRERYDVRGRTVLVTGAAGGLGRLFATRAASDGAGRVVLWDRDLAGLARVAAELGSAGVDVRTTEVDLAEQQAIEHAAGRVLAEGGVDVLVNNAGVVRGRLFWEHDNSRDTRLIMAVNALAPMYLTRVLLDDMLADPGRPRRILTVASAAALVANPRMSVYAASKWAALGWSDSLRLELEQAGLRHVRVTTYCPTYIGTGMFAGAGGMLMTRTLPPARAAARAWEAMLAGRPLRLDPWTARFALLLRGVLPRRAWDAAAGGPLGIYHSMDEFVGRPE
jgi:all-trans-retinol dehydrogenase (NAD+)